MRFKTILCSLFFTCLSSLSHTHEIALTFDDLPVAKEESLNNHLEINKKILQALAKFKAPAIGFVNEGKLYNTSQTEERIATLKLWIDHGHPLGNHTYSHKELSFTELDDFKEDLIKGAEISKKLMRNAGLEYRYFRYPHLDTGATPEIRTSFEQFLKQEGYTIAPLSLNTDDWKFNHQLFENPKNKKEIIENYLRYTREKLASLEEDTKEVFGRNIKHIWLFHVNVLNSYAIEDVLKIARELGYDFITLDQALEDEAYTNLTNHTYPSK